MSFSTVQIPGKDGLYEADVHCEWGVLWPGARPWGPLESDAEQQLAGGRRSWIQPRTISTVETDNTPAGSACGGDRENTELPDVQEHLPAAPCKFLLRSV